MPNVNFNAAPAGGYDIFIIAGQSNAVGIGKPYDPALDDYSDDVFQLGRVGAENYSVIPAEHPLDHHVVSTLPSISFASSFTQSYINAGFLEPGRQILLIPAAKGESGFSPTGAAGDYWNAGTGELYNDLVLRVNAVTSDQSNSEISGVLWHQGETGVAAENYTDLLDATFEGLRLETSMTGATPIILGEMVEDWVENVPARQVQQNRINDTVYRVGNTAVVQNNGLLSNEEVVGNGDVVHYSAPAQRDLGFRYFAAWDKIANGGSASVQSNPEAQFVQYKTVDFDLALGVIETSSYGRNFSGPVDADGIVRAGFTGTTDDLVLSLSGYDVDFQNEVEVSLNGESLGYLGLTGDQGTDTFEFYIPAADQRAGDNVITFEVSNPNYIWGISDILIEPTQPVDFDLALGVIETSSYGRNFSGPVDADGIVRAGFTGTTDDLVLSLSGYDVDFENEVEVSLNGESLGYLGLTGDQGTDTFEFYIPAADQRAGDNVITFEVSNPNYIWGISDILIEEWTFV